MTEDADRSYDEEHSEDVETESINHSSRKFPLITQLLPLICRSRFLRIFRRGLQLLRHVEENMAC